MKIEQTLKARKREESGKGAAGRIRAKGDVPGVFYTAEGENILVQTPSLPLEKIYESVGHTDVFNLEIDSADGAKTYPVLIWSAQRHPYKKTFLHIDYYGVDLNKDIKVDVPVEVVGLARGVKLGGVLETYRESVRLASKPLDMPHKITIDVSDLNIGDTIQVKDLVLPENVRAIYDHDYAVVSVMAKSKEDEEGEGGEEAAAAG